MSHPMNRPPIWKDHVAFCRRHGFDPAADLEPQFKQAFEAFGRDFEQIRGSVSSHLDGLLFLMILFFRTLPWFCSS